EVTQKVLMTSKYFLFNIREPISDINILHITKKQNEKTGKIEGKRARKKASELQAIENINRNYTEGAETIVHSYYLVDKASVSLDASFRNTNVEKIRVLTSTGWRDADIFEAEAYKM